MAINSMTGFASATRETDFGTLSVDVKSVNAKGLDVKPRVPSDLDGLDLVIKKQVATQLGRGSVSVSVRLDRSGQAGLHVDGEALASLLTSLQAARVPEGLGTPSIDALLAVRGIVVEGSHALEEEALDTCRQAVLEALDDALDRLKVARAREGSAMETVLREQLDRLEGLRQEARSAVGPREDAIKQRFEQGLARLEGLKTPVSDDRLAQELAMIAVKLDITEEIDRLDAHIAEARTLLASKEPVGRRLDFLCQELNREANTLCSKASDVKLTRIGLDMKTLIDQFREQIQNIE